MSDVEVTQADRDAAADWYAANGQGFVGNIRNGFEDDGFLVQAFARHRLRAAQPESEGWQPIETAPRDGTSVLVTASGCGCEIVQWAFGDQGTWLDQAGMSQGNWPTHWRHLPPPPATPADHGEGRG